MCTQSKSFNYIESSMHFWSLPKSLCIDLCKASFAMWNCISLSHCVCTFTKCTRIAWNAISRYCLFRNKDHAEPNRTFRIYVCKNMWCRTEIILIQLSMYQFHFCIRERSLFSLWPQFCSFPPPEEICQLFLLLFVVVVQILFKFLNKDSLFN